MTLSIAACEGGVRRTTAGRLVEILALVLLAAGLAVVGPRHAPWFDEAQSWLIARDSNPLQIAAHWARLEGSPALWQYLLWGFQRAGGAYAQFWFVSGVCSLAGAAVVMFRAPFPLWMRVGLVFGYFYAYQYAVVARSYALDLLLIPLAADLFILRTDRPRLYGITLGLLANTNAFGFIIAAVLVLELAFQARLAKASQRRRLAAAVVLVGLALALAFLQVWPAPAIRCRCGWEPDLKRALLLLVAAFIERLWPTGGWDAVSTRGAAGLTVMLAPPAVALVRAAGRGWLALGVVGGLLMFVALIHTLPHHAGMIELGAMFCLWVSWTARDRLAKDMRTWLTGAMAILIGYQALDTAGAWRQEIMGPPYAPARAAAAALRAQGAVSGARQIGAIGYATVAVEPYFTHNIFGNAGPPRAPAFYRWQADEAIQGEPDMPDWERLTASHRYVWLLAPAPEDPLGREMEATANRDGYVRVAAFPAEMIWKTGRTVNELPLGGVALQLFRWRSCGSAWPQASRPGGRESDRPGTPCVAPRAAQDADAGRLGEAEEARMR